MKITVEQLKKLIREQVEEVQKNIKFEVVIDQDRDQFTDMMGGGSYYADIGWPEPLDDPNCETYHFDKEDDALKFANEKQIELNNLSDEPNSVLYRALVFRIGIRGKKTLIEEFSS